eukprot:COSAG06_NODE_184_length_20841_cov_324.128483_6_plen_179_part_00
MTRGRMTGEGKEPVGLLVSDIAPLVGCLRSPYLSTYVWTRFMMSIAKHNLARSEANLAALRPCGKGQGARGNFGRKTGLPLRREMSVMTLTTSSQTRCVKAPPWSLPCAAQLSEPAGCSASTPAWSRPSPASIVGVPKNSEFSAGVPMPIAHLQVIQRIVDTATRDHLPHHQPEAENI